MKAVVMTAVGGPEVLQLQEVAEPAIAAPGQIKVRLKAAGVNPIDTKVRGQGLFYSAEPPAILGCDGAGEVVEVGTAVRRFKVGDGVWFCHGGLGREPGNYAEYAVLDAAEAELKPATAGWEEAGAAPLVLITAWEALFDRGRLVEGQTVLIHAGAGGVGHVAIQLAAASGATVLTTVSSDDKAAFVKKLGADHVINYRSEDVVSRVMDLTAGCGVDLAFDTVGPAVFEQTIPAVAHYGTLVTILDPAGVSLAEARLRNLTIAFTLMLTPMLHDLPDARARHGEILQRCSELMNEGKLQVVITQHFTLAQATEAHSLIGSGHTSGKLVLVL